MICNLDIPEHDDDDAGFVFAAGPRIDASEFRARLDLLSLEEQALVSLDWLGFERALNSLRPTRHALRIALMPVRARLGLIEPLDSEIASQEMACAIQSRLRIAIAEFARSGRIRDVVTLTRDLRGPLSALSPGAFARLCDSDDAHAVDAADPSSVPDTAPHQPDEVEVPAPPLANVWRTRFIALACVASVAIVWSFYRPRADDGAQSSVTERAPTIAPLIVPTQLSADSPVELILEQPDNTNGEWHVVLTSAQVNKGSTRQRITVQEAMRGIVVYADGKQIKIQLIE